MLPEEVEKYVKELGYETAEYLCDWNGFRCYEPSFSDGGMMFIGLPQIILMSEDGSVRMATEDEAMQFIDDAE